MEQHEQQHNNT